MTRRAACSCGSLSVIAEGEPMLISVCHCRACQRRTGSSFGTAVFYPAETVETTGESKVFERIGSSGKAVAFHFCPQCGTTLFWFPGFRPGLVAVAFGAFDDQEGLVPSKSVYEEHRHPWVRLDLDEGPAAP
ncbi:GFA family protein [Consotaella aegiceratis]|uniref:GFA family protein n=1 Tax=Consotaella aegiceratis TaxID=3097961 RepID=UPI002F40E3C9